MEKLHGVPESMLIPVAARALETYEKKPIVKDPYSEKMFRKLNYDFDQITKDWTTQLGISIRTYILDMLVNDFVKNNEKAFIINIGCGLDTRFDRLSMKGIPWVDIDVPDVINIRKRFFTESENHVMIAKSMFDYKWIDEVKSAASYADGLDILVIFEGVLMYFDDKEIQALIKTIDSQFSNCKLTFAIECCSETIAKHTSKHKSVSHLKSKPVFKSGYNQFKEAQKWFPKGIRLEKEYNYFDYFHRRWGIFGLCRYIPFLKNRLNNKILVAATKR